ncbi:MAG: SpoIIE family protein phosphatase [Gammaproteobacteria bacterium]|nr:SpoIIE family protein phosphatase [Gammaproteobacteria bacterium]
MDSIQEKLRVLRNNYIQNLDNRCIEIRDLFTSLLDDWNDDSLAEFHRLAHSLKGSAATFNLDKLSYAAASLETALIDIISLEGRPDPDTLQQIESLFMTLCEYLKNPEFEESAGTGTQKPALANSAGKSKVLHSEKLTILLTDDEAYGREQVSLMLQQGGHEVIQAGDGREAIEQFKRHKPDLIIMDVVMPQMNGYEAAREIKRLSGENFVPIIFLTGLTQDAELVQCIENGGDDFLIKPVNPAILHARIYAMQRIRELNNKLFEYQSRTEDELHLAKHIFEKITSRDAEKHERLDYLNEPAGHFSGDILVHHQVEGGNYYVMLGDFTGHGLTAAIGAIPAADTFHSMANKNAALHVIADEINTKLVTLLPTAQFLACTLISINLISNHLQVLNCGLPSSFLFDEEGNITQEFVSKNLALGILANNDYSHDVIEVDSVSQGYHYLCFSDGLQEAHNDDDVMYGNERIFESVRKASRDDFLGDIRAALNTHTQGKVQHDDITIMSISF